MLARKARIPGNILKDIGARTIGRSIFFVLKIAPNNLSFPRFAIVVGSNVDRRAYRRHTLKRRAVHFLKDQDLGAKDVILIVLPPANRLDRAEFIKEIQKIAKI